MGAMNLFRDFLGDKSKITFHIKNRVKKWTNSFKDASVNIYVLCELLYF